MKRILSKCAQLWRLLRLGDGAALRTTVQRWLWSDATYHGFAVHGQRVPVLAPTKLAFRLRPMTNHDVAEIFDTAGLDGEDLSMLLARRRLWDAGFTQAYVGVTEDNRLCYLGWIIDGATQRRHLIDFFAGTFPPIGRTEMLIEASWIPPWARGNGVMAPALNALARAGARPDTTRIITFVQDTNLASTIGVMRSGMAPYITRLEHWRLLRNSIEWLGAPAADDVPDVVVPVPVLIPVPAPALHAVVRYLPTPSPSTDQNHTNEVPT